MRYLLNIQYDGTLFHGWQIQPERRTVQGEIEKALSVIHQHPVVITGAGRTDAKVHATDQYAHFDSEKGIPLASYHKALNGMLTDDVHVKRILSVPDDFHARYDAYQRHYHYILSTKPSPFESNHSYYVQARKLNLQKMETLAKLFIGKHDFSSFSKFNPDIPNPICEVKSCRVIPYKSYILFSISADRFLHNMVRRILGAILTLSYDDSSGTIIEDLLANRLRHSKYKFCVPPQGLYLIKVRYPLIT
jgi:tRNA pseudouridine38-40 synthase